VRCLLGELDADAGSVSLGTKLSVGYFKQSHEAIDPDLTVVRYLQKIVARSAPTSC
jgi:ATPase subunit of ABC transporter with duplicated ATPase domains